MADTKKVQPDTADDTSINVAESAAEIRREWATDEKRQVCDPVGYVVAALVKNNIKDLEHCSKKAAKLLEAKKRLNACIEEYRKASDTFLEELFACRKFCAWMYDPKITGEAGLSVTQVIAALGKSPETLYNAVMRGDGAAFVKAVMQTRGAVCPACESKIE